MSHFLYWIAAVYSSIIISIIISTSLETKIYFLVLGIPFSILGSLITFALHRYFENWKSEALYKNPFGHFLVLDGFVHNGKAISGSINNYTVEITYDLDIGTMQRTIIYTIFYDMGLTYNSSILNKIETLIHRYPKNYEWHSNGVVVRMLLPFNKPNYLTLKKRIEATSNELKLEFLKPLNLN